MVRYPKGEKVYRDPYSTLRRTKEFLESCPQAASHVTRLWFNGLYVPTSDGDVTAVIRACPNLRTVSAPWTLLRHATANDWEKLLLRDSERPLESLELIATKLSQQQKSEFKEAPLTAPLMSWSVDFGRLKRLKLFGNTDVLPVCDDDLRMIARTATQLEEFVMTCISTVTIEGRLISVIFLLITDLSRCHGYCPLISAHSSRPRALSPLRRWLLPSAPGHPRLR